MLIGTPGKGDPAAHTRMTYMGHAERLTSEDDIARVRGRFLGKHPKSELYVDFPDFAFWRITPAAVSLNAGFGKAYELAAADVLTDVAGDIISIKAIVMSIAEQEELLDDICNDVLGYGPLEPLLARDDIADIMVNGANTCFIEVDGKVEETNIRFRDNQQLMNICQRIVSQVGRRVDEASPICDARLADGSRVNVIAPPLAIDGPSLTIRKFKKDKLTLDQLVSFGSISQEGVPPSCRSSAGCAATS